MNIPSNLIEVPQEFVKIHYCFSDFTVIIQLLGGIFLVASFLDYTNKFINGKIERLSKNLQVIVEKFQMRYSGGFSQGISNNNKTLNKLHSSFLNNTVKIQNLQEYVNKNVVGVLATKFLDKYLYLGLYCLFMLFFASFENKFLATNLPFFEKLYSAWFYFSILSLIFLVGDILFYLICCKEIPIIFIPFIFFFNFVLASLFIKWPIDIRNIDLIVILSLAIIIITPIIHGVFFVVIEIGEFRAKKLDMKQNSILEKIVFESVKSNGGH